jgi:hypothetical protein
MAVNIKSPRVDELIGQLRQLTGRGATEIVREAQARPFAAESLYDSEGLPG